MVGVQFKEHYSKGWICQELISGRELANWVFNDISTRFNRKYYVRRIGMHCLKGIVHPKLKVSPIYHEPLYWWRHWWNFLINIIIREIHRGKEFNQVPTQWKPMAVMSSNIKEEEEDTLMLALMSMDTVYMLPELAIGGYSGCFD